MRRALILFSCVATLVVPAVAHADALIETPFAAAGGTGAPTCLRPTGLPGEFVTSEPAGRRAGRVRLWAATPDGPRPRQILAASGQLGCATVASDPAGGALLAVLSVSGPSSARLLVATRRPFGRRFGPLRTVARTYVPDAQPSAAIGAAGDGIVSHHRHAAPATARRHARARRAGQPRPRDRRTRAARAG